MNKDIEDIYLKSKQMEAMGKAGVTVGCGCFGLIILGTILVFSMLAIFGILAS